MTREERMARIVADAPISVQEALRRAFSGSASPRAAIKVQCLVCTGYDRNDVKNCLGYSCPLWAYRPFQVARVSPPDTANDTAPGPIEAVDEGNTYVNQVFARGPRRARGPR